MKIIAEVGSNIKSKEDALNSIVGAAGCRTDAVKFQYFTDVEMYGFETGLKPIIEESWIPELKQKCDEVSVEFMCTFFDPLPLMRNIEYIDTIKIASSDMLYTDLLEVAKDSGKDMLVSTGGHSIDDVIKLMEVMNGAEDRLTLLYCESAYPARCTDFRKVELLQRIHNRVGFSDHSLEIFTNPMIARDLGLTCIEKHVDFCGHKDTPDHPHSLSGFEFFRMVEALKKYDKGVVVYQSPEEDDMVAQHNRRLVATKPIKKGEMFMYNVNFGQYRSREYAPSALPGYVYQSVDAKIAKRDFEQGDCIEIKD